MTVISPLLRSSPSWCERHEQYEHPRHGLVHDGLVRGFGHRNRTPAYVMKIYNLMFPVQSASILILAAIHDGNNLFKKYKSSGPSCQHLIRVRPEGASRLNRAGSLSKSAVSLNIKVRGAQQLHTETGSVGSGNMVIG